VNDGGASDHRDRFTKEAGPRFHQSAALLKQVAAPVGSFDLVDRGEHVFNFCKDWTARYRCVRLQGMGLRRVLRPQRGPSGGRPSVWRVQFTNLREDPLGRMYARRQIDHPQYLGGREYQAIFDSTQIA
jgi:hypothetical protein